MAKESDAMQSKTRGSFAKTLAASVLIVAGTVILIVLLTYGGPVFPHVAGPAVLLAVGVMLLATRRKGGQNER